MLDVPIGGILLQSLRNIEELENVFAEDSVRPVLLFVQCIPKTSAMFQCMPYSLLRSR